MTETEILKGEVVSMTKTEREKFSQKSEYYLPYPEVQVTGGRYQLYWIPLHRLELGWRSHISICLRRLSMCQMYSVLCRVKWVKSGYVF